MSFYQWRGDDLLLKIHVQPRAKENSITGIHGDMLKLKSKTIFSNHIPLSTGHDQKTVHLCRLKQI